MQKVIKYKALIVVLIFLATTINYLDRQIIGLLKPVLETSFHWTETDFAHIVMGFTAAYSAGLLFFGYIIDRLGSKWGYAICVVLWSLAGIAHGFAKNVTGFITARIGLGLGESGNFPAGMKTISEWFTQKQKGLVTGIFNAGTSAGVIVALLITPWILTLANWQSVFYITGGAGFVWLFFWLLLYKEKRYAQPQIASENNNEKSQDQKKMLSVGRILRLRSTWAVIIGKLFIDPIYWFFLFWLPSYFSARFQLDFTKPSLELMIIYSATGLGSIAGGYFSSALIKKGWKVLNARKFVLLLFAIAELSIISLQFINDIWLSVAIISLAVGVHQAWATNIFTMASDMFPSSSVSTVVGISGMAGAVGGIAFPILVGYVLDLYKGVGRVSEGYNIIFIICGCTYLVIWVLISLLTSKIKV